MSYYFRLGLKTIIIIFKRLRKLWNLFPLVVIFSNEKSRINIKKSINTISYERIMSVIYIGKME